MASRGNQGGGWTNWTLDESSNKYYRARQNWAGEWEYDYQPAFSSNTHQQAAPRGDGVDDLESSFNAVSLGDNSYGHDQSDPQDYQNYSYTAHGTAMITSAAPSGPSSQPSYAGQSQYPSPPYQNYSSAPYKGKERAYDPPKARPKGKGPAGKKPKGKPGRGYNEGHSEEPSVDPGPEQPPFYEVTDAEAAPLDYDDPADNYETPAEETGYGSGYAQGVPADHVDDHVDSTTIHGETEEQYYPESEGAPIHDIGEPELDFSGSQVEEGPLDYPVSSDAYPGDEGLDDFYQEADGYGTGMAGASSSVGPEESGYEPGYSGGYDQSPYQQDTGQQTPRARSPEMAGFQYGGNTMDQTLSGERYGTNRSYGDDLFSRYIVEPSSRFQPGSVFKIYWSEPLGDGLNATVRSYMDKKGEKFHYSFRRFIVVASDEGHSTCVPILTYGHRACTKRGVKAQKHGIVYQIGHRPLKLHGEPDLGFESARVELFERTEKLDKESRVNYSKLVTIEHNYRVFFIGRIHPRDFQDIVGPAVDTCWGKKRRHHR